MSNSLDCKLHRIAGELLDRAADEFNNHGCNDWSWPDYLTAEDRLTVAREMMAANVRKPVAELTEPQLEEAAHMAERGPPDWWIMRYLGERLQR